MSLASDGVKLNMIWREKVKSLIDNVNDECESEMQYDC